MKINVEFNTVEEMQEFAKLIGAPCKCNGETVTVAPTEEKEVKKDNSKSDKKNMSKKSEKAKTEDKPKEEPKEEAPKVDVEKVGEPEPPVTPPQDAEPTEDVPNVTKEQLRELCANVMKSGKQSEVKEIFKKYGATKLTELKEEDRAAAYKDVEALQ